ncbi:hypothetical protein ACFFK0_15970 [Paenibacillus chartarius]|uniref:Uncharacterized protein n=1 Tax=Paenibacillus chartarius TaxID=747481 RepID=A0ABV6DMQ4_9BACL
MMLSANWLKPMLFDAGAGSPQSRRSSPKALTGAPLGLLQVPPATAIAFIAATRSGAPATPFASPRIAYSNLHAAGADAGTIVKEM